ncbi:MAG: alpha/beta fold hydrolase [Bacteroidota bacterium]
MSIWKVLLILAILGFVVGFLALHFLGPVFITQPGRAYADIGPKDFQLQAKDLTILTNDEIALDAYWVESEWEQSRGVIIMIHGIGGCKEAYLGLARELAGQGIESFLFDGRAHGQSEGKYCTYGAKEKEDVQQIINHIQQEKPGLPIGVWGNSLGGCIAIQALASDERLAFGVIESTFSDLSQIVYDYGNRILGGWAPRPLTNYALWRAGRVADFAPKAIQPLQAAAEIEQPVFVGHGAQDDRISATYGKALFDQFISKDKVWELVPGGDHFNIWVTGGEVYQQAIIDFIDRQLPVTTQQ